jgi:hypothetical protein
MHSVYIKEGMLLSFIFVLMLILHKLLLRLISVDANWGLFCCQGNDFPDVADTSSVLILPFFVLLPFVLLIIDNFLICSKVI